MPRMGDIAAQDAYDVPLDQGTGVGWANRAAEALYARPPYDPTVVATTASPLVNITEGDIGRATEAAMGVSGGGLSTKGIKAYHSSPHDFERFDLSKIGTGEGAQAYGHGLYFAESPAVSGQGGQYWKNFAHQHPEALGARYLQDRGFDRSKAIADAREWVALADRLGSPATNPKEARALLQLLESDKPVGPRTYEVNINADPAHMLDWDKPLREQSQLQRDVARKLGMLRDEYTGSEIYKTAAMNKSAEGATSTFREAGIPGIKYLDQGSRGMNTQILSPDETTIGQWLVKQIPNGQVFYRGADEAAARAAFEAAPKPSSNYVVFDPNIIRIDKKYAVPGAIGAGGMGALASQDAYQPEERM